MKIIVGITGILVLVQASKGQGTFQNLDFEQANPVSAHDSSQPSAVTVASALPAWALYFGTIQQTEVFQNTSSLGQATGDLLGPTSPPPSALPNGAPGIIDGQYTIALQAGYEPSLSSFVSTSLQQTGTISTDDDSLVFKAWNSGSTSFSVSFAGNNLTLVNLGTGPNYTLYGADVSAYAGQTGLLAFTANAQSAPSFLELDDINFSPTSVPEPGTVSLIVMGGLALSARRWRAKGL